MKLVVKPDMLFGKRGKSGLVALNLDIAQVKEFVKERLGVEVVCGHTYPLCALGWSYFGSVYKCLIYPG
jgi:succinyl-CoA synthetase beta subunit